MKSARRRAREYALQGLYQWRLAGHSMAELRRGAEDDEHFAQADAAYFAQLLEGSIEHAPALEAHLSTVIDRRVEDLSPIERSILLLAVYELAHVPEIPYRVAINEAVELAKSFGGTDGHKYVNGVLDKLAPALRPHEALGQARKNAPAGPKRSES